MVLRLFLLAACLASAAAINVPACPKPSTKPISCFQGKPVTWPGKTGLCRCDCGTNGTTANAMDSYGNFSVFAAASFRSCTVENCRTNFVAGCGSSFFVQPDFKTFKDSGFSDPVATVKSKGAICSKATFHITSINSNFLKLPPFMVGATVNFYGMNNATTAAPKSVSADCAANRADIKRVISAAPGTVTALVFCNTDQCNKAKSPPRASG